VVSKENLQRISKEEKKCARSSGFGERNLRDKVEKTIQINLEASWPHVNVLGENKFLAIASIVLAFVEYNQANMSIECH
jgi:hypothetical protein